MTNPQTPTFDRRQLITAGAGVAAVAGAVHTRQLCGGLVVELPEVGGGDDVRQCRTDVGRLGDLGQLRGLSAERQQQGCRTGRDGGTGERRTAHPRESLGQVTKTAIE